jgi:hydroxypyruvate reductase
MNAPSHKTFLENVYKAGVDSVSAAVLLQKEENEGILRVPENNTGELLVIALGKGAAAMAYEANKLVVARDGAQLSVNPARFKGYAIAPKGHRPDRDYGHFTVLEGEHPVPSRDSIDYTREILDHVKRLPPGSRVIIFMTGGASASTPCLPDGISYEAYKELTETLLAKGFLIGKFNTVRKHINEFTGGDLYLAIPTGIGIEVFTRAVSDVKGNDISTIGSGPTVPDPSTLAQAQAALAEYGVTPDPAIAAYLADPKNETAKPGDLRFGLVPHDVKLIATSDDMRHAAIKYALSVMPGLTAADYRDYEGKAVELAQQMANEIIEDFLKNQPPAAPRLIVSGGETETEVTGTGAGGRNATFLLALMIAIEKHPRIAEFRAAGYEISALAADTDGIDGSKKLGLIAGAVMLSDTYAKAVARGLDPEAFLKNSDAHGFFKQMGLTVGDGPTLTNVNDCRLILVTHRAPQPT